MNEHLRKVAAHHDAEAQPYGQDYFSRFGLLRRLTMDNIRRILPAEKDVPVLDAVARMREAAAALEW